MPGVYQVVGFGWGDGRRSGSYGRYFCALRMLSSFMNALNYELNCTSLLFLKAILEYKLCVVRLL